MAEPDDTLNVCRQHGFDRIGPDVVQRPERGFTCNCMWHSAIHGDRCPEHGKQGVVVLSEMDELKARLDAAEADAKRLREALERLRADIRIQDIAYRSIAPDGRSYMEMIDAALAPTPTPPPKPASAACGSTPAAGPP